MKGYCFKRFSHRYPGKQRKIQFTGHDWYSATFHFKWL